MTFVSWPDVRNAFGYAVYGLGMLLAGPFMVVALLIMWPCDRLAQKAWNREGE